MESEKVTNQDHQCPLEMKVQQAIQNENNFPGTTADRHEDEVPERGQWSNKTEFLLLASLKQF